MDSIIFGTAQGGSQGPGQTLFAESPHSECATGLAQLPNSTPGPGPLPQNLFVGQEGGSSEMRVYDSSGSRVLSRGAFGAGNTSGSCA